MPGPAARGRWSWSCRGGRARRRWAACGLRPIRRDERAGLGTGRPRGRVRARCCRLAASPIQPIVGGRGCPCPAGRRGHGLPRLSAAGGLARAGGGREAGRVPRRATTGRGRFPGSATPRPGSSSSAWPPPPTAPTAPGACSPATARATSSTPRCGAPGSPTSRPRSARDDGLALDGAWITAPVRCAPAGQQAHARPSATAAGPSSSASWPCSATCGCSSPWASSATRCCAACWAWPGARRSPTASRRACPTAARCSAATTSASRTRSPAGSPSRCSTRVLLRARDLAGLPAVATPGGAGTRLASSSCPPLVAAVASGGSVRLGRGHWRRPREQGMAYHLGIDLGTTYTAAAAERSGVVEALTLGQPHGVGAVRRLPARRRRDPGRRGRHPPGHQRARVAWPASSSAGSATRRPIILGGTPVRGRDAHGPHAAVVGRPGAGAAGRAAPRHRPHPPRQLGSLQARPARARPCARSTSTPRSMLPEPVAAATFYASQRRLEPGSVVAVYDLGGGTFDAAMVRRKAGRLRDHRHARGHRAPRRHRLRRGGVRPRPRGRAGRARPPRPRGARGPGRRGPPAAGVHRRQGGAVERHRRVDPGAAAGPADRGAPHPHRVRGDDPAGHLRDRSWRCAGRSARPRWPTTRSAPSCWSAGSSRIPLVAQMVARRAGPAHRHRRPPEGRHRLRRRHRRGGPAGVGDARVGDHGAGRQPAAAPHPVARRQRPRRPARPPARRGASGPAAPPVRRRRPPPVPRPRPAPAVRPSRVPASRAPRPVRPRRRTDRSRWPQEPCGAGGPGGPGQAGAPARPAPPGSPARPAAAAAGAAALGGAAATSSGAPTDGRPGPSDAPAAHRAPPTGPAPGQPSRPVPSPRTGAPGRPPRPAPAPQSTPTPSGPGSPAARARGAGSPPPGPTGRPGPTSAPAASTPPARPGGAPSAAGPSGPGAPRPPASPPRPGAQGIPSGERPAVSPARRRAPTRPRRARSRRRRPPRRSAACPARVAPSSAATRRAASPPASSTGGSLADNKVVWIVLGVVALIAVIVIVVAAVRRRRRRVGWRRRRADGGSAEHGQRRRGRRLRRGWQRQPARRLQRDGRGRASSAAARVKSAEAGVPVRLGPDRRRQIPFDEFEEIGPAGRRRPRRWQTDPEAFAESRARRS